VKNGVKKGEEKGFFSQKGGDDKGEGGEKKKEEPTKR